MEKIPQTFSGQPPAIIKQTVSLILPALEKSLPKGFIEPERYLQMCVEVALNPALSVCEPTTILSAMVKAATLGFSPVNTLAQCYFIPRNVNAGSRDTPKWVSVCEFQIGYLGWKALAERSGTVDHFFASEVRKGDEFHFEYGLNPVLKHLVRSEFGEELTHVYAYAHMKSGTKPFMVMDKKQVEHLRMKNAQNKGEKPLGAWATDYGAMARAKVMKMLIRTFLPTSEGLSDAIAYDESYTRPQEELTAEDIKQGKMTIEPAQSPEAPKQELEYVHEDVLLELEACKTNEQINEVVKRQTGLHTNPAYKKAVTAMRQKIAANGK